MCLLWLDLGPGVLHADVLSNSVCREALGLTADQLCTGLWWQRLMTTSSGISIYPPLPDLNPYFGFSPGTDASSIRLKVPLEIAKQQHLKSSVGAMDSESSNRLETWSWHKMMSVGHLQTVCLLFYCFVSGILYSIYSPDAYPTENAEISMRALCYLVGL